MGLILPLALPLPLPLRPGSVWAQTVATEPAPTPGPPALSVPDAAGVITVDGRLDEPAWTHALWLTSFYETWPGDNVLPPVRTAVALTYDPHFLYLGVRAQDPDPRHVHAAYTDRDNVRGTDDYISFLLDTRGEARVATIFRISPRGVQADGVFNDAQWALGTPDDLTPDFAWDAAVALSDSGWTAELRIPLRSLRYPERARQAWGLIVHRVYPRDFVRSFFSVPVPRGSTCLLCHEQHLELAHLPAAAGVVVAPYASARTDQTSGGPSGPSELRGGVDVKWMPSASTALDATLRPDFSQLEADVAQLGVNTAFALFYPEKRPFFLEGADLFQTPLQAVYTRSIAAPDWGARATGELARTSYTALLAHDRGGGTVILPGPAQSSLVTPDFSSTVALARTRTALPWGFVGWLATDREIAPRQGGGGNRLVGPDFLWNATVRDQLGGELLATDTRVPRRPDLTPAWDGRRFASGALDLSWHHLERLVEWYADYRDVGADFRADNGFVPQVGVRLTNVWANASIWRTGAINLVSPFGRWQRVTDQNGALVSEYHYAGLQLLGAHNLNLMLRYSAERLRAQDSVLPRRYAWILFDLAPGRRITRLQVIARVGSDVDVVNGRAGRGAEVWDSLALRVTDHLQLEGQSDLQWLDVHAGAGAGTEGVERRLFTAGMERVRATYHFTREAALRLVVQHVRINRDPTLYLAPTSAREGGLMLSALFTYRWNWATAAYVGVGDERDIVPTGALAPSHEQLFVKLQVAGP